MTASTMLTSTSMSDSDAEDVEDNVDDDVDVGDEDEGSQFIQDIKQVQIDHEYLYARWSSKAQPRTPSMTHIVRNTHTGYTHHATHNAHTTLGRT